MKPDINLTKKNKKKEIFINLIIVSRIIMHFSTKSDALRFHYYYFFTLGIKDPEGFGKNRRKLSE